MSYENFIPELWAKEFLMHYERNLVYASPIVVNRDYEGTIQEQGDSVKINTPGNVTVKSYTGADIDSPESPPVAQQNLIIEQAEYFNFWVKDIDKKQASGNLMSAYMKSAAYQMKNAVDSFGSGFYTEVPAANLIGSDGTPKVPTAADSVEYIIDLNTILDDNDVPEDGRYAIVPPWVYALLLKHDHFMQLDSGDRAVVNGVVGKIDNMTILKSNNVPNTAGTKYKIQAGHPDAITFAEQLTEVEPYRPEGNFGDAVKGLQLYDGKLVRPSALAIATFSKS